MAISSFETETVSCINDLELFSNDEFFVLVVCFEEIQNLL